MLFSCIYCNLSTRPKERYIIIILSVGEFILDCTLLCTQFEFGMWTTRVALQGHTHVIWWFPFKDLEAKSVLFINALYHHARMCDQKRMCASTQAALSLSTVGSCRNRNKRQCLLSLWSFFEHRQMQRELYHCSILFSNFTQCTFKF